MDINASMSKQFAVESKILEPTFRYIPDRDTIQRLLTRCSNMKDDLGEFDLYEDNQPAEAEAEIIEAQKE